MGVPRREPMTLDTIFDIASLTKVIATTTAVMQLVARGEVRLNDPVVKYIPEFGQNGKEDITVRQLLIHHSGLKEDLVHKYRKAHYKEAKAVIGAITSVRKTVQEITQRQSQGTK